MENGKDKDKKLVTIIVNTQEHQVEKDEISYEEVVVLAYPSADFNNPDLSYIVNYKRAHGNADGSLTKGQKVKIKEGMIFNVTETNKS